MNYEEMVKEAYEEIVGEEKTAGLIGNIQNKMQLKSNLGAAENKLNQTVGNQLNRQQSFNDAITKRFGDNAGHGSGDRAVMGSIFRQKMKREARDMRELKPLQKAYRSASDKYDQAKIFGKSAMAYYEEAQLAKEAAEADYAEACAYEDAALAILGELGYLD